MNPAIYLQIALAESLTLQSNQTIPNARNQSVSTTNYSLVVSFRIYMIIRITLFIIILLGFASCSQEDNQPRAETDHMLFGHFYGFCHGEQCIEIFKLTETQLLEDTLDQYPSYEAPYNGDFIALDDAKFDLVKSLADSIPEELFTEQSNVIGSPDASDGGGIYVAIVRGAEAQFWLIDQFVTNQPLYLQSFVAQVNESISLINN